ncbi:hypothetical protein EniLVp02_0206 [Vibrio phage EniLVp02]
MNFTAYVNGRSLHLEDAIPHLSESVIMTLPEQLSAATVSVKWDGAPAVVFGVYRGSHIVATKSFFNKTPVFYTSLEEIGSDPKLSHEMKLILGKVYDYTLPFIDDNPGLYMADLLYHGGADMNLIQGERYAVAHSNVLAYAAPLDTPTGKRWMSTDIGLAVHTRIDPVHGKFPIEDGAIFERTDPLVWYAPKYQVKIPEIDLREWVNELPSTRVVRWVGEMQSVVMPYCNSFVRNGKPLTEATGAGLMHSLHQAKGRLLEQSTYSEPSDAALGLYLQSYAELYEMKNDWLGRFEVVDSDVKTFYQEPLRGHYVPTGHEGFVIESGSLRGVKLVNRDVFSKLNFSSTACVRGWAMPQNRSR